MTHLLQRALPGCLAIYWSAMVLAMHWPATAMPPTEWQPWDKGVHSVAYAGLTLLLLLTSERFDSPHGTRGVRLAVRTGLCVLVALLYGLLDEATQPLTGRTYDLRDWAADAVGIVAIALPYLALRPLFAARLPRE